MKTAVFVRVVSQDRDRGYMLLVGYDPSLVQRTAIQITTLSAVTRASLDKVIETVRKDYNASEIRDITDAGIKKKLKKMFGEV